MIFTSCGFYFALHCFVFCFIFSPKKEFLEFLIIPVKKKVIQKDSKGKTFLLLLFISPSQWLDDFFCTDYNVHNVNHRLKVLSSEMDPTEIRLIR
jgi:hypothetical protein